MIAVEAIAVETIAVETITVKRINTELHYGLSGTNSMADAWHMLQP